MPDPSQEIMKKVPEGYRIPTIEERLRLMEAASEVGILRERVQRLQNESELHKANSEIHKANMIVSQRDLEDTRRQHLASVNVLEKVQKDLGIDPNDKKGVLIENGVTYVRVGPPPAPPPPVTAIVRDADGKETEVKPQ
jgi:hypothetical protein